MNIREHQAAAKKFTAEWSGRGDEKSDTQLFWVSLLARVFGIVFGSTTTRGPSLPPL